MDMTGERRIPAPREVVWQALNDPVVLKASIPGCESLEKISDSQMKATAAVKIGPISARFTGTVQLTDIDPPNGYNIGGEGQGGVAGFAKGGAKVALADDAGATLLRYDVHAQVGGKIAQLGARLIDATAKQMADAFFTRFSAQVEAGRTPELQGAEREPATQAIVEKAPSPSGAVTATPLPEATRDARAPAPALLSKPVIGSPAPQASEIPKPAAPRPAEPAAISILSLIPPEPFGLPLAFWIGGGVFTVILLLVVVSS